MENGEIGIIVTKDLSRLGRTELTPELLRLFIEKIVVHEKEAKWSKHAPQTVEIYYNGIGFVDSQQQDMESLQPRKTEEPRQAS